MREGEKEEGESRRIGTTGEVLSNTGENRKSLESEYIV